MVVGILKVRLSIPGARSLKDKRKVVRSVKDRVKARFNVSIAEVDNHDIYQTADIAVAVAASDGAHADSQIQSVIRCIEQKAIVTDIHVEFINS